MLKKIAVLITCHNRRKKTLTCLHSLYKCSVPNSHIIDVFLVDDSSTDGTAKAVRKNFPQVNVIIGTGSLYWNGGMRLAWQTAAEKKEYDFYFWLNDDTFLFRNSFEKIFQDYDFLKNEGLTAIVTGVCTSPNKDKFTFGGNNGKDILEPRGKPKKCKYMNGNFTLIPNKIYQQIGSLSPDYSHAYGDFDYGLRAQRNGFACFISSDCLAVCADDKKEATAYSLRERVKWLSDNRHSFFKDLLHYQKTHWGIGAMYLTTLKVCVKIISPNLHKSLKKIFDMGN